MERAPRTDDKVVTCFADLTTGHLRENRRTEGITESLQEIGYQGIRTGDLVIAPEAWTLSPAPLASVTQTSKEAYAWSIFRFASRTHLRTMLFSTTPIAIREMARSQWIAALATGIRERSMTSGTDFRTCEQSLPVPPAEEQAAIVRYLDHADELINRYISAKERLIALLEEQRQAVIHRAVTAGSTPTCAPPNRRREWIGDMPAHWEASAAPNPRGNAIHCNVVLKTHP